MSSKRMPGKVLAPILGEPMIIRQLERIAQARTLNKVVVATSRDHGDDPLAAYLTQRGAAVFRGPGEDAVERCALAVSGHEGVTHVVRLFCDNPLIDPEAIDAAVSLAQASGAAYVGSGEHGGVEVVAAGALALAAATPRTTRDRRDLRFFFGRQGQRFASAELDDDAPRWTVDTPADFAFVQAAYEALHASNPEFRTQDVLAWLCARSEGALRPAVRAAA
jgi:spore coat polysaccharide biosynthesis protein SpsF